MLLRRLAVVVTVVAVLVGMGGVSVSLSHGVSFGGISPAAAEDPAPGETWTARTASDETSDWYSVTYGNGVFVAVACCGPNQVMTSPDGVTWTTRTAAVNDAWRSVTYGNGVFVAVASSGTNQVMTSTDNGVTWTARTAAKANGWRSVVYGNGVFVAVADSGTDLVMTSTDNGETWTARSAADPMTSWISVTYGDGVFVAVALSSAGGVLVMTSTDNGVTWTAGSGAANSWRWVTFGNGLFVAVASGGTNRVMTSGSMRSAPAAPTGLVATAGDGSASIAFTAGADGGAAITKYQVKVGNGSWTDAVGTTSPITISGLTNYQTANIRLRAVNAAGAGAASAAVSVRPQSTGPTIAVAYSSGKQGAFVGFAFNRPAGSTLVGFTVRAFAKGTTTVVSSCQVLPSGRSCYIPSLTSGTQYDIRVQAYFTLAGETKVRSSIESATSLVRVNS
jgi:hypothetical protein